MAFFGFLGVLSVEKVSYFLCLSAKRQGFFVVIYFLYTLLFVV